MTNAGIVLLALTVLFWLLLCAVLHSVVGRTAHGDAAMGQAIEWIYVCILVFLAWVCLSGLLLIASSQNIFPAWMSVAVVFLCPASGAATIGALYLLGGDAPVRWAFAIPAIIPGLLAAYVFALSQPSLRAAAAGLPVSIAVCAATAVLCIAAVPAVSYKLGAGERKEAARKAALADPVQKARRREEGLAQIRAMTPDMPIESWHELLNPESEVREEALAALRKSDRRQSDAERLVSDGNLFYLAQVPYLDLEATPELCRGLKSYLWNVAFAKQLKGQNGHSYQEDDLDESLNIVPWFTARGCNCDNDLKHLEENIQQYFPDSPARQKCLTRLAGMKSSR